MNVRFRAWTVAAVSATLLAACGGGNDNGDGAEGTGSGAATIGSSGGVVRGEGAEVRFPAKALASDVTVRVAKNSNGAPPLPPAATAAGAVYLITPHGGALGVHAEVSIPVERAEISADEQLLLITAQPGDTQWTVLSGATYSNGALRAPVMHFSYFQAIVLTGLYMPSLVTTLSNPTADRVNNVGGPGIGTLSADFEYGPASFLQDDYATLQARLTYPLPTRNVRAGVPTAPPARACLPSSYGHTGATWRFLRNGTAVAAEVRHLPIRLVAEDSYPRVEAEIQYARSWFEDLNFFARSPVSGFGALHVYGQDAPRRGEYAPAASTDPWAVPPPRNSPYDDVLSWSGQLLFDPGQHNGRMRIDLAVATDCNLLLEAVPLAFNLNLNSRLPGFDAYAGVTGRPFDTVVPSGDTAVIPFLDEFEGSTVSIAWEFSTDLANWQKQPVPSQYIRDDGSVPRAFSSFGGSSRLWSIVIPNVQPRNAGWYRAWSCSSRVCVGRQPVQLVVQTDPPSVRTQPSAQIVMVGETASFGVSPNGIPGTRDSFGVPLTDQAIRFQWQRQPLVSAVFGGPWTTIAGATGQYFDTPPTVAGDSGWLYRVVLSNSLGSVVSNGALLTVVEQLAPPVVQSQPGNSSTVLGGTAVFVATAGGTAPLSYQWRRNGVNVSGANSPVLTLPNVTAASDGLYDLVVTNRAGSATSNAARLLVTLATPVALAPTIAAPPASITVAGGQAANFAVAVNGTGPYSYAWYRNGAAVPIAGADAASFGIASATPADAGSYAVRVTNSVGSALSAAASLIVTPAVGTPAPPIISTAPVAAAALPGATATFAAAVSGTGPFSYQWRRDGNPIAGATASVLHIPAVSASDAGQYVLDVGNAVGSTSSPAVALILIGAPVVTAQPAATTIAAGASARFQVTATGDGLRYQWTRNGLPIGGATSASHTTPAVTLGDSAALYAVVVYNGAGAVFSQGAVLTVTPSAPAARAWGTPVLIETDNAGSAEAVQVAANASGQVVTVWQQSDGTTINIYANRYTPAAGWGTPQRINPGVVETAQQPHVAIDNDGNAIAVWMQSNFTQNSSADDIWASRYTAQAGWGAPVRIENGAGNAGQPRVAVDGAGNAIAVFSQQVGGQLCICAGRFEPTTGWAPATAIDTDVDAQGVAPQIAMEASGRATVVWQAVIVVSETPNVYQVRANRYTPAAGWGSAVRVGTTAAANAFPRVAVDGTGNAAAVWVAPDGTWDSIWSARTVAGGTWTAPVLIETDNTNSARAPHVAFDGGGNAIAVWAQSDGLRDNVLANRYVAGAGWGTAVLIETDNAGSAYEPQVVIDGGGNATAVWSQRNVAGFTVNAWANRYSPATGWGTATTIDNSPEPARSTQIAIDGLGNVTAAWAQTSGTRTDLWATSLR